MAEQTRVLVAHVSLGTDPSGIEAVLEVGGRPDSCLIRIGAVTLVCTYSSPEALRALATAASQLADLKEEQAEGVRAA